MLTYLLYACVGVASIRFISHIGPDAVAAAGVGGQIFYAMQTIMLAVSAGTTALIARSWGVADYDEAIRITLASLALGLGFGLLLAMPGIFFAYPIASVFGLSHNATQLSADFIFWLSIFNVAFAVNFVMAAALRAAGDAKTPLWFAAWTNIINLCLLYPLVFGFGPLPPQGVAGAAQATGIAFALSSLLILTLWLRNHFCIRFAWMRFMEKRRILDLLYVGYPAGVEQIVLRIGFFAFMIIIGQYYGTIPFAAYNIGVNLLSLCFVVGLGFSVAGATLVGQHLGMGDTEGAVRHAARTLQYSVVSMTLLGLVAMLLAEPVARLMVDDAEVVHYTVIFIYILGAAQPLMAIEFALGGVLRGAGDTRFPLKATLLGLIVVRLTFAGVAIAMDLPVEWVYAALLGDYLAKSIMLIRRFRSARWQTVLSSRLQSGASQWQA